MLLCEAEEYMETLRDTLPGGDGETSGDIQRNRMNEEQYMEICRRSVRSMNIGKACAIFERIDNEKYTEQEKLNAVKLVIGMPTHNGITKDKILNAFRWFFDWAVEESSQKQTNADRIRSMSDEELADFIEMKQFFAIARNGTDGEECTLQWLQSEVEE